MPERAHQHGTLTPTGERPAGWSGAPDHPRERERLAALEEVGLFGALPDEVQNQVTRMAADLCGTPISAVSLVGAQEQWFSGSVGLACDSTSREVAFCAHTILSHEPLVVNDAAKDARFASNPLVTGELGIRFYAGVPLITSEDLALGSLCVIDTVPKELDTARLDGLKTLAALVTSQLELRRSNLHLLRNDRAKTEILGRLTKIASRVPGLIYQCRQSPDGLLCFPYASEGIREVYRVAPDDVAFEIGRVIDRFHPDDRDAVLASIAESARTLSPWKREYRVAFDDGEVRWHHVDAVPEREPDGGTLWHGFINDVTERKLAQQAMERLNAELSEARQLAEASNRAKSAFLANMSHEIRTPLTAILGYADMLGSPDDESDPDQRAAIADTIQRAGNHLLTVINDILDISKVEADSMTIENVETDLPALVCDVWSLMNPGALGKGLTLLAVLRTPIPDRVFADPTRLRQVLMNLIGNAIKFTEQGAIEVAVGTTLNDDHTALQIDVSDTGLGIGAEQRERLFQAFGQADDTVTRRYGGSGLGLSICRSLARLMGGDVVLLRSAPGEGSCFRLTMPLLAVPGARQVSELVQAVPHEPARAEVRLSGRILLAEDGPDNQRIITYYLERAGASVLVANNGREALAMIEAAASAGEQFDLLLTDIQMPEIDGYTLASTLRAQNNTIPIIALTAHTLEEHRERCVQAGCNGFVSKPVEPHSFLTTCAAWINRPQGSVTPSPQTRAA